MGVDLGKGSAAGGEDPGARAVGHAPEDVSVHRQPPGAAGPAEPAGPTGPTGATVAARPTGSAVARTTPPPAPYRPREPAPAPQEQAGGGGWSAQSVGLLGAAWTTGWIIAFANGVWWLGLAMLMLGGPLFGYLRQAGGGHREGIRARRRQRHRELRGRREQVLEAAPATAPAGPAALPPEQASVAAAERSLAATLVRVETSADRFDAEAVELVREVDRLLRPLLAHLRTRGADAQVRHDLETLASEHLPRTVEDYLVLPDDYAREHRTAAGTTPADELRSQLLLLVEGCKQLRDAVHDADLDRQQQQSRFLEAKFRRSDLDL
ncbi:hypothetical protein [Kineococcus sp. SYSU DK006]|uniref:hypothetical protein n=1 Tax=Kineococcus sp. SYSU DK006 TaxID=3383127 RepID=UPI003D7C484D